MSVLFFLKSKQPADPKFEEIKRRIIEHLKSQDREDETVIKSLVAIEIAKGGMTVGTIREWKGKKYIKGADNKWRRYYNKETRGAKASIKHLIKKVEAINNPEELLQLVLLHRDRFSDEHGRPIPLVQELSRHVSERQGKLAPEENTGKTALQKMKELANKITEMKKEAIKTGANKVTYQNGIGGTNTEYYHSGRWNDRPSTVGEYKGEKAAQGEEKKDDYSEKLSISSEGATSEFARRHLIRLAGKDLENKSTGIKAQINSEQRNKILNDKAVDKSKENGFIPAQHYSVAANLDKAWEKAKMVENRPDRKGDKNIASIKRFESQIVLDGNPAIAYITVKESVEHGHKVYSMELQEIKKSVVESGTPSGNEKRTTPHGQPQVISDHNHLPKVSPKTDEKSSDFEGIKSKYLSAKAVEGDEDELNVGKETLSGKWKLVEADTPTASHDETTFHKTEGFPTNEEGSTINDRDYGSDKAAQEAVMEIAADYDAQALSFDSPVIVTKDGVVISGNNRTMSSKLAAKKGTDKKYIEALKKKAKKFGFTEEQVGRFKNPRVIFEADSNEGYSTAQFAKFNESGKKAMNPIESAVKVSKMIRSKTVERVALKIGEFETLGELYSNKKAVHDIFGTLQQDGIIGQFDKPQYVTDEGITGAGKEFLETVLIGSVINEKNIRGLNREGCKSIRQKLVRAITPLIENKGMKGYSITEELNNAVDIVMQVAIHKDKFNGVEEYSKQQNMFGDDNKVSIELAKRLEGTQKEFAEFMQTMNGGLKYAANGEADIFLGEVESRGDILSRMLNIEVIKKALAIGKATRKIMADFILTVQKSDGNKLDYFKKLILKLLGNADDEDKGLKKSILQAESAELKKSGRGLAVGTIREWNGRKYVKIAPGKWRPKYDSHTRGAKMSIAAIRKKVDAAKSAKQLLDIVMENQWRFSDLDGKPLTFIKELADHVAAKQGKREAHNSAIKDGMAKVKANKKASSNVGEYRHENAPKAGSPEAEEWKNNVVKQAVDGKLGISYAAMLLGSIGIGMNEATKLINEAVSKYDKTIRQTEAEGKAKPKIADQLEKEKAEKVRLINADYKAGKINNLKAYDLRSDVYDEYDPKIAAAMKMSYKDYKRERYMPDGKLNPNNKGEAKKPKEQKQGLSEIQSNWDRDNPNSPMKFGDDKPKTASKWENPLAKYKDIDPYIVAGTMSNKKRINEAKDPDKKGELALALVTNYGISKDDAEKFISDLANISEKDRKKAEQYKKDEIKKEVREQHPELTPVNIVLDSEHENLEKFVNGEMSRFDFRQHLAKQGFTVKDINEVEQFAATLKPTKTAEVESKKTVQELVEHFKQREQKRTIESYLEYRGRDSAVKYILDSARLSEHSPITKEEAAFICGEVEKNINPEKPEEGNIKKAVSEVLADIFN